MFPICLVESAVELFRRECLAVSRVNADAPACQTGASWAVVSGTLQARRTVVNGQDDRKWSRHDERLVANPGGIEPKDTLGRTCSASLNRRMRTRM